MTPYDYAMLAVRFLPLLLVLYLMACGAVWLMLADRDDR